MLNLSSLNPQPPGFGRCRECSYRESAPPALCFSCARQSLENVSKHRCERCDLPLEPGELCGNPLCTSHPVIRQFDCNYAIAIKSGYLDRAIKRYKFEDKKHWATIFARVLVGFLEEESQIFDTFDLIVASPTFISRDPIDRSWDHTRLVIETAHAESRGRWPFDIGFPKPAIIKTKRTTSMTNRKWKERQAIAHGELRASLAIPDRRRIAGKSILVYDDVFTDGHTLSEVARCLREKGGASDVCGVTLARQPFRKKATAS
jgi:predicted amidophosphoribosyltransferase